METFQRVLMMFRMSINGVLMHKLRSMLTVLGLVFGVSSVIVMLAVAEGASRTAQEEIAALGVKNIIVRTIKPTKSDDSVDFRSFEQNYGLTYDDLQRIKDTLADIQRITPMREFRQVVRYGANSLEGRLVGVHPSYFDMNRIELARGRFLNSLDLEQRSNVCVVGDQIAREIFPATSPIGKAIQVDGENFFRIVGVQRYRTPSAGIGSSLSSQDYNRDVIIPLTTDRSRIGDVITKWEQGSFSRQRLELSQITLEVHDRNQVQTTADAVRGLLAKYHPDRDFAITIPLDLLRQAQATQRIFNVVLGATAAISLLVGGIGIMNIMLATVSERTREIGIRRALGAKQSDIVLQFLIETASLSLFGTLLGVLVGLWVPSVVTYFSGMATIITGWSILIAASVSVFVGIVFGLYPARRAAQLDPIEALRHS